MKSQFSAFNSHFASENLKCFYSLVAYGSAAQKVPQVYFSSVFNIVRDAFGGYQILMWCPCAQEGAGSVRAVSIPPADDEKGHRRSAEDDPAAHRDGALGPPEGGASLAHCASRL